MLVGKSSHVKFPPYSQQVLKHFSVPRSIVEPHVHIRAFRTTFPYLSLPPPPARVMVVSHTQRCLRACAVPDL